MTRVKGDLTLFLSRCLGTSWEQSLLQAVADLGLLELNSMIV